jgi:hypothetical protein
LTSIGNWMALQVTKSIGSPLITICIYSRIHITTLQTNNQSWLPWYTEPKLFVMKIPFLKKWNFSSVFSRK